MQESAGTLLYRYAGEVLEVLLVHPSGNYNRKAPWSIPKGLPNEGESFEDAARRETVEETGVKPGHLISLGHVDYTKSRKRVHCFAGPAPSVCEPRSSSWEVDKAEFVSMADADKIIHPDQRVFISRLQTHLEERR